MAPAAPAASPTSGEPNGQPADNNDNDTPPVSSSTPDAPPPAPGGNSNRDAEEPRGFHRDGRVRNPVPSRLQGLTDNSRGNFAIMHIDMAQTKASERNAAAKRTSEGTAAQARRANLAGWQPVKRSKSAWHTDGPHPQTTRAASNAATTGAAPSAAAPTPTPAGPAPAAGYSWSNPAATPAPKRPSLQETKAEQARLLTLLRTLHPVLVVDQLCKALAYFGGVPDAPPPSDGLFPNSAATNGSGSLLVAWLSEIYPPVDNPGAIGPPLHLPPLSSVAGRSGWGAPEPSAGRRGRGRPKGSKSSKVRKDKGTKKPRPSSSTGAAAAPGPSDPNQPTLVDDHDHDPGHASSGNAADDAGLQTSPSQATAPSGAAPGSSLNPDTSVTGTPGARKRGRPKGSKNRPKQGTSDPTSSGPAAPAQTASNPLPHAPTAGQHMTAVPEGTPNGPATMQGPPSTVPGNVPASLAATATSKPPPETGTTPALSESQPQRQQLPSALDGPPAKAPGAKAPSARKRTAKRPAQNDSQAPADAAMAQADEPTQNTASSLQGPRAKRRRTSKESSKEPGAGTDSQTLPTTTTASPALDHQGLSSGSPPLSASRSFDSQNSAGSRPSNTRTGSSRGLQQNQQPHQQSPDLGGTDQQRQHHPVQAAGPARPRSQVAGAYAGPPQAGQQQSNVSPQILYALRQRQQQMGPGGRPGATFDRDATGSHPQHAPHMDRQSSGGSGQRNVATTRAQQQQQIRGGAQQAHGYTNQRRARGAAHGNMSSFPGFGEQSYLNMDYGLTERDVQEAAAITAFSGPTQLHGQHMYRGMEPR